jgi:hypothetical protein
MELVSGHLTIAGDGKFGQNVEADDDIITSGGDIKATTGDVVATAGDIIATAGDVIATAGDIKATAGKAIVVGVDSTGDVEVTGSAQLKSPKFQTTATGATVETLNETAPVYPVGRVLHMEHHFAGATQYQITSASSYLLTVNYTPKNSQSYILIEYFGYAHTSSNAMVRTKIYVNGSSLAMFGRSTNDSDDPALPLMDRYTNTNTSTKSIKLWAKTDGFPQEGKINYLQLKITEIKR